MDLLVVKAISNLLSHSSSLFKNLESKPVLDHGPSLEEHISPKCLLRLGTLTASSEVNVLKI